MIERVTIYGDSFADPKYEPKSLHPTWYGLLKKEGYDVTNLGKSGSGPMFSFKHMYQNAHSYNEKDIEVLKASLEDQIKSYLSKQKPVEDDWGPPETTSNDSGEPTTTVSNGWD